MNHLCEPRVFARHAAIMITLSIECEEHKDNTALQTHGMGCIYAFVAIILADLPLRAIFLDEKTRWFALHFMVNMFVAYFCFHDLVRVVSSPLCTMVEPSSSWQPSYFAFMLHFYHLACFTSLRLEDGVKLHPLAVASFYPPCVGRQPLTACTFDSRRGSRASRSLCGRPWRVQLSAGVGSHD